MLTQPKRVIHRPLVIYTVTIAWVFTALVTSLVALLGIAAMVTAQPSVVAICVGSVLILVGGGATAFHLYMAWSFYHLSPFAYTFTRNCWTPQLLLATGFWKWLDRQDVQDMF